MQSIPQFPFFRPIELQDRQFIMDALHRYGPETSEMTFTNFFIWRNHCNFQWSVYKDWLCVVGREAGRSYYAMGPVGPAKRAEVVTVLLEWLRDEKRVPAAAIERADSRLVSELADNRQVMVEPSREHFDYVYLTQDLIGLAGNRYRTKRNRINQFHRSYGSYVCEPLEEQHLDACRALQEKWCLMRRCDEDLNLLGEWDAVKEMLGNYRALEIDGAVIVLDGKVKAFTVGELMNADMAVIHIEKADPEISGLYQFINQQFCVNKWQDVMYINREQDLGIPGLREAKLSYNPHRLVEKYKITLKSGS